MSLSMDRLLCAPCMCRQVPSTLSAPLSPPPQARLELTELAQCRVAELVHDTRQTVVAAIQLFKTDVSVQHLGKAHPENKPCSFRHLHPCHIFQASGSMPTPVEVLTTTGKCTTRMTVIVCQSSCCSAVVMPCRHSFRFPGAHLNPGPCTLPPSPAPPHQTTLTLQTQLLLQPITFAQLRLALTAALDRIDQQQHMETFDASSNQDFKKQASKGRRGRGRQSVADSDEADDRLSHQP